MDQVTSKKTIVELSAIIQAYESTQQRDGQADLIDFIPHTNHPQYIEIVRELVCVDLEYGWQKGQAKSLDWYRSRFPQLFEDGSSLQQVAFEEYRQRIQAGEVVSPLEYHQRYGVETANWFRPESGKEASEATRHHHLSTGEQAVGSNTPRVGPTPDQSSHRGQSFHTNNLDWKAVLPAQQSELLNELSQTCPQSALEIEQTLATLPMPGDEVCGFRLLSELGSGTFGRVYLASQGELANRPVALKISPDTFNEAQTLAQLQHTNIVPIHSIHHQPPFTIVCMPFFGATTFATLLSELKTRQTMPSSGRVLLSTVTGEAQGTEPEKHSQLLPKQSEPGEEARVSFGSASRGGPQEKPLLDKLESLNYVEAVLWIMSQLAEALGHAHERGIVHRDLKPANILLTDEGRPMLLDFNLAQNTRASAEATVAKVAGTLPYMAPEQLRQIVTQTGTCDHRSDIYSLGVVIYELLTAQLPFPPRSRKELDFVTLMLGDRKQLPQSPKNVNDSVSPAVASIVLHCLQPDPRKRYQNAKELNKDLQNQLNHLPLAHAPEPSLRERMQKWNRRHPKITPLTTLAILAFVVIGGLVSWFCIQQQQQAILIREQTRQAAQAFDELQVDLKCIPFLVASPHATPTQQKEGVALCQRHANKYRILETSSWESDSLVTLLTVEQQQLLRRDMGELLWMWAHGLIGQIQSTPDSKSREDTIQLALRLNRLAQEHASKNASLRPLFEQRATLLEFADQHEDAAKLRQKAANSPSLSARDHYLFLIENFEKGRQQQLLNYLQAATRKEPDSGVPWLFLGNHWASLGKVELAENCFDIGISLTPRLSVWVLYTRGVMQLEKKNYVKAKSYFDQVVQKRPKMVEARMNRALAAMGRNKPQAANADLTKALEDGATYTRIYFMRARARMKLGDAQNARKDWATGLRLRPSDEQSWRARGAARLSKDPKGALADFEKALELAPRSKESLQHKAHVLSEYLKRPVDAIRVLDKALKYHPRCVPAIAGRGVLLARSGKRAKAHADAEKALALSKLPLVRYQVAGIYALTSQSNPKDVSQALGLLGKALLEDERLLNLIPGDHELDPIQKMPEFRALLKRVRAFHKAD